MNSITCRVCQTQNATGNKFCSNCGASLKPRTHITCPNCFHRNPLHLLYCDNCGTRLERAGPGEGDPAQQDESEGPVETSSPTQPFSLPARRPGDTGELDPDRLPDWLRTGEHPTVNPEVEDSLSDLEQSAGEPDFVTEPQPDEALIPDWLLEEPEPTGSLDVPAAETDGPVISESTEISDFDEVDAAEPEPEPLPHSAPLEDPEEVDPATLDWLSELSDISPDTGSQSGETPDASPGLNTSLLDDLLELEEPAEENGELAEAITPDELPAVTDFGDDVLHVDTDEEFESEVTDRGWVRFGPEPEAVPPEAETDQTDEMAGLDTVIDEGAQLPQRGLGVTDWLSDTVVEERFIQPLREAKEAREAEEIADQGTGEDEEAGQVEGREPEIEFSPSDEEDGGISEVDPSFSTGDTERETFDWVEASAGPADKPNDEDVSAAWMAALAEPSEEDNLGFDDQTADDFETLFGSDAVEENPEVELAFLDQGSDQPQEELSPELSQLLGNDPPPEDPFATIIEQGSDFSLDDVFADEDSQGKDWLDDLSVGGGTAANADQSDDDLEALIAKVEPDEQAEPQAGLSDTFALTNEGSVDDGGSPGEGDAAFLEELAAMRTQTTTQVDHLSFEGAPGWFHSDDEAEGVEVYKQVGGPLDGLVGVVPIAPTVARLIEDTPNLSTEYVEETLEEQDLALWSATLDAAQSPELQNVVERDADIDHGRRQSFRLIYLLLLLILLILFFRLYMPSVYNQIAEGVQFIFRLVVGLFR